MRITVVHFRQEHCDAFMNIIPHYKQRGIDVLVQVAANFRKTATNFHYEFNIRHLSNVFQGLLVAQPDQFKTAEKFVLLWMHESERVYGDRLVRARKMSQVIGFNPPGMIFSRANTKRATWSAFCYIFPKTSSCLSSFAEYPNAVCYTCHRCRCQLRTWANTTRWLSSKRKSCSLLLICPSSMRQRMPILWYFATSRKIFKIKSTIR